VTKIVAVLKKVIYAYQERGFKIRHILGDEQFEHTRKHIRQMGIILNITSPDKLVPQIER